LFSLPPRRLGPYIVEDVSKLWICYPLGVRENHQRA
jgi:hypothetical protein